MYIGSSSAFPHKGLVYTIVINAAFNLKFPSQLITFGPVAKLAAEGAENSRMVLVAMVALGGGSF